MLATFLRELEPLPEPDREYRWRVRCMGEECRVAADDVPYVVQRIEPAEGPSPKQVTLIFPGNYRETLDPETLFVGKENVPYCRVRGGHFTARFNRQPYLDLSKWVAFDKKKRQYCLVLGKKQYLIQGV